MTLQVVVVGAGIIGAAISQQVTRVGAQVRVLDVVAHPGQGGATRSTWSWLNANKKHPQRYRDLNLAGLQRWKADWPSLVHPCGSLVFDDDDPSSLSDPVYPGQRFAAEQVLQLEPFVAQAAAARGAHLFSQEAWVDPQLACRVMLTAAEAHGAEVKLGPGQQVVRLVTCSDSGAKSVAGEDEAAAGGGHGATRVTGVVTADGVTHAADVVVLAAGAATISLAAQAGVKVPLLHKPAAVAMTQPLVVPGGGPRRLVHHLLSSAKVFIWQRPDGSLILGDTRVHEDNSAAWGQSLLQRATELVPELSTAGARVESVQVSFRPWPQDGHPIIGASSSCAGLYIATMHSGMTLAPEVARLVAIELAHWDREKGAAVGEVPELMEAQMLLQPYRLHRDFETCSQEAAYSWK